MFSNKTLYELVRIIDKLKTSEIIRIISVFNFTPTPRWEKISAKELVTGIFTDLRYRSSSKEGPFSENLQIDLLQFLIDDFFESGQIVGDKFQDYPGPYLNVRTAFSETNRGLANCLKRDGYVVVGREIRKLLPEEIQEAKIESELLKNLEIFSFTQSKGHLLQGVSNHSQSNWAAANSQFRSFIESLMIEISNALLPKNEAKTFTQAVTLLSETAGPPFLSMALNEIPDKKDSDSFVFGFWSRLHPDGSHPGLSDEDDSSFRYHVCIVYANYLLRRLANRKTK